MLRSLCCSHVKAHVPSTLGDRETRHQTKTRFEDRPRCPAMLLRLVFTHHHDLYPSPWPLIHSSPCASAPSSLPALRPPASLPRLVSCSGCLQLHPASPASTPLRRSLSCFAQKLLGSHFEEGRQGWLPPPAVHARLRRAIVRFEWSRVAWSPWTWRKAGSHARSFFGVGHRA